MLAADSGAGRCSLAATALVVAGCGGSLPRPPAPPASDAGVYAFEASAEFSTRTVAVRGTFEVTEDTVRIGDEELRDERRSARLEVRRLKITPKEPGAP